LFFLTIQKGNEALRTDIGKNDGLGVGKEADRKEGSRRNSTRKKKQAREGLVVGAPKSFEGETRIWGETAFQSARKQKGTEGGSGICGQNRMHFFQQGLCSEGGGGPGFRGSITVKRGGVNRGTTQPVAGEPGLMGEKHRAVNNSIKEKRVSKSLAKGCLSLQPGLEKGSCQGGKLVWPGSG